MSTEKQTDENKVEEAVPATSWPRIVTLKHPFEFGKRRITSLEFRRGKNGDMQGINLREEVPMDDLVTIASRLCGETTKLIRELDFEDSGEVMSIALDFYAKCLAGAAGKKP